MRLIKFVSLALLAFAALLLATWLGLAQYFSRAQPAVTRAEAETSLRAAIGWMKTHESDVLADGNQALWRMVHRAAELTHDADLNRLYASYYERYYQRGKKDMWERWLNPASTTPVALNELDGLEAYQRFFMYAASCDASLLQQADIKQLLSPDACSPALITALRPDPSCSTHQLMGLAMMRERQCGDAAATQHGIGLVQQDIETQLRFDPRVRDAYIQRVLMLQETGAAHLVRPVWLRRVLQAQQPDGGWAGLRSIKLLFGDLARSLGHEGGSLSAEESASDFHATAQGLLLMSLLVADSPNTTGAAPHP